ncbi:MAG: repeat-containing protein [Verrucomicrobiaceae bacterium]|nr:repeat-containing protein [Verrucomicrobiaceae bacterium]
MHAFRFLFLALAALFFGIAPAGAQSSDDFSEQYLRAYMIFNEGDRLVQAGNAPQAVEKYKQSQGIFDNIAKSAPNWEPVMMKMRREKLADALASAQIKAAAPVVAAPAPAPAPQPGEPPSTSIIGQFQPAQPAGFGAGAPIVGAAPSAPATSAPPSLDEAMKTVRNAIDAQTQALKQQLTEMQAQVGRYGMAYETAIKERDQVSGMYQTLTQTATAQQTKINELEKQAATNGAAKAELDKVRSDYADTTAQLKESQGRLTKAEGAVMKQTKDLMENSMRLTALQKDRDDLAKKLETISTDKDALKKELEKITHDRDKLAQERDTANTKLIGMQASGPVPANLKDLSDQNERLKKDLDDARKQVATLQADASRKDQEIVQLKGQLTQIQGELVRLKKDNAAAESQVSELTLNLKELRARIANPKKGNPTESDQIVLENQLLRSVVLRQLRQQARQQQQKSAVIAEIQKTENASKDLIDQVEQLGGTRFTLSDEERKLFTTPQLQEFTGEGGIQATLMAKSDSKKAGAPAADATASGAAAVDGLLEKGNAALSAGKFDDAATAYSDVLRADPKNASGFAGLAWARVQQNKLDEAEVTLKKSLAYDANNATAHYMLGVTMFRRDRLNEALSSFQKSVELNGKNARARHYLGVISSKMGLGERAEREFKAALAIDPDYGEAYFNLAVLYVTWDPPKWDDARKNYKDAVKKGVKADANLEKILNGGPAVSKR